MKKLLTWLMAFTMMFSSLGMVFACEENQNTDKSNKSAYEKPYYPSYNFTQKSFQFQENQDKKDLIRKILALEEKKLNLEFQYDVFSATGDDANLDAIQEKIDALEDQISDLKDQLKEIVAQRYQTAQKMYSNLELKELSKNKASIKGKYGDATTLDAGAVCVNNNLIKFDALPYVRGGKTMVPVRAITQELGVDLEYQSGSNSVTISDGDTEVIIYANGKITLNGQTVDSATKAEFACNRTYVPLRFLAETFGLKVTYNTVSGDIDIDDSDDSGADDSKI